MPSNTTPETATVIAALPYTDTLDLTGAGTGASYASHALGTKYNQVWWEYTTGAAEYAITITADRSPNTGEYVSLWTGTPPTLTEITKVDFLATTRWFSGAVGGGFWRMEPVDPNTTYYIQFESSTNDGGTLTLTIQGDPGLPVPPGSLCIQDDKDTFPAVIFDATSGQALRVVNFSSGETGTTLPNGYLCLQGGEGSDTVNIYAPDFSLVTNVDVGPENVTAIANDYANYFYVGTSNGISFKLYKLDITGSILDSWTLAADMWQMAVDRTGEILYTIKNGDAQPIKRFDLTGGGAMSDLVAGFAGESTTLCFGDGFIDSAGHLWFAYKDSPGSGFRMRQFDVSSGAVLQTVSLSAINHYALDYDDLHFQVWKDASIGLYTFERILISDGSSVASSLTHSSRHQDGLVNTADEAWGSQLSCNMIITQSALSESTCAIWPVWLSDDSINGETFLVFSGSYLGNGQVLRYDFDGNLVKSYPYDPTDFPDGMMGLAAMLDTDACVIQEQEDDGRGMIWLAGHHTPEGAGVVQPGVLPIRLTTGEVLAPVVAIPAETEVDQTAGFTALDFPSGNGDPTDKGLPPKPTVNCGPLSNLRTPQPNAGCNDGGIGSTPTYTGASGVVPVATDPVEATLTGKRDILIWTEIQHTQYNDDGTETADVLRYAHVDIPDTLRKEGRLAQAGSCEQASSDGQGNMKSASGQLSIFDFPDRPLATRRADRTRLNFNRDEVTVYAISDADRRNGATPKMLARGLCYGDSNGSPGTATLDWVDHLHVEGGSFSPDKTMPMFRYPVGYYTNAPADLANYFMPVIYGEVTDNNAKDPITGLVSERGKHTPHLVDPESTLFGETYARFNNNLFAIYRIDGVYGSDCGGLGCWGMTAVSDGKKPNSTITLTGRGDFSVIPGGGWAQLVLWTANGRSEHRIIGVNIGSNSVKVDGEVDADLVNGPIDWMIERIDHAPRRVRIAVADRQGFDVMVPGYAGYTRPTTYEDFTDPTDGRKWRVTDFGIRGPLLREHLGGGPTIATNTIGVEDQGDGSGLPIVDGFTAYCHWMDNCLHQQRTTPPISDNLWAQVEADLPAWSDGLTKTRESSFRACQALTASSLGGYGVRIGIVFDQGMSLRDACQLWNDNLGCRTVNDEHGRMKVWMVDKYADTSTWPRIDHVNRIFGSVAAPRVVDEAMNVIRCGYDWDPDAQTFRVDGAFVKSDQAIRRNKGYEKPSKHYDFKMLTEKVFAEWRLNALLGAHQDGPIRVPLGECDLGVFDYPIGTGVILTSVMGPGAEGYVDQPVYIEDRLTDLDQKTVALTMLDVGTDLKVVPADRQFIATNNASIAPIASLDADIAPLAVA
jgi:hypothetical protein